MKKNILTTLREYAKSKGFEVVGKLRRLPDVHYGMGDRNILYGLMRPATSIAAATALMAAFALSPLMAVSSKKRGAQSPLFC